MIHRDYCAENLLLAPSGRIHVVDNESIDVGPLDYDLARTWYRWPMGPRQRAAYWKGYARYRDPGSFSSSFAFWAVKVLVESSLFRLDNSSDASDTKRMQPESNPPSEPLLVLNVAQPTPVDRQPKA